MTLFFILAAPISAGILVEILSGICRKWSPARRSLRKLPEKIKEYVGGEIEIPWQEIWEVRGRFRRRLIRWGAIAVGWGGMAVAGPWVDAILSERPDQSQLLVSAAGQLQGQVIAERVKSTLNQGATGADAIAGQIGAISDDPDKLVPLLEQLADSQPGLSGFSITLDRPDDTGKPQTIQYDPATGNVTVVESGTTSSGDDGTGWGLGVNAGGD